MPRVLMGVSAWLLGAILATAGSILAVAQLGQDLLEQQNSRQVSVATVNAELAQENSERPVTHPSVTGSPSPSPSPSASTRHPRPPGTVAHHTRSAAPSPSAASELLVSQGGTVAATCERGGAYLAYWSPQQGFEVGPVVRGPAQVAKVTFRSSSGGIVLSVTCGTGVPVKHVTKIDWSGGGHDD